MPRLVHHSALCAILLVLGWASVAAAQGRSLLLLFQPDTGDATRDAVASTMAEEFELIDVGPYVDAALGQGVDPVSDEAFQALVPALGVSLAMYVEPQGQRLMVELRAPDTGAVVETLQLPMTGGGLDWNARGQLLKAARERVGAGGGGAGPAAAPAETFEPAESAFDTGEASADADAEGGGSSGYQLQVGVGVGVGARDAKWPSPGGSQDLSTGFFPALALAASLHLGDLKGFTWAFSGRYRTSIGAQVSEPDPNAPAREIGIRAHSLDVTLAPVFRFGDGWELMLELGYAVRNLRPDVHHLLTPNYSLAGPLLRPSVRLPFGSSVALTVAPEFSFILGVGEGLEEHGTDSSGLAFGVHAWLGIGLSEALEVRAGYRYAVAQVAGSGGSDAEDVEQFALAALWGKL